MSAAEDDTRRDRELENILGQLLVSSYQSDKLAEMTYEKMAYKGSREVSFIIPNRSGSSSPPLAVTIRVEPYGERRAADQERGEQQAGAIRAVCFLESPDLDLSPDNLRRGIQDVVAGSFEWFKQQGTGIARHLKLEDWNVNVSIIESKDSRKLTSVYKLLGDLEASRKGQAIER